MVTFLPSAVGEFIGRRKCVRRPTPGSEEAPRQAPGAVIS